MSDPLDELIVKEDEKPDLQVLAEMLKGNIKLDVKGQVIFEEAFYKLKQWEMILVYLLARKAAVFKNLIEEESTTPKEISDTTSIPAKIVSARLARDLKGLVVKEKGHYKIPNYALFKCKNKFSSS